MLNSEPYSMGAITDYGVNITTKSSPQSVAIEKAQDELRQEYDVRQERRRELEFLEKGGNPLDFKFFNVAPVSVQSTSLVDQIAEQNVISCSEAKGSFAFTASPHGDSVESSGKAGSSLCRETNTADNLMLFGGDSNDVVEEKTIKKGLKRTNAAQPRQSLHTGGHSAEKKAEDSGLPRSGAKGQAYVRRNRSKPSRESVIDASVRSSVVPAKNSEPKYANGDQCVLSISRSKQAGPKCENAPNPTSSDEHGEQVAMELDRIQTVHDNPYAIKSEATQSVSNSKATEALANDVIGNQQLEGCGEIAAAGASVENPDVTSNIVVRSSNCSTCAHDVRQTCADDEKFDDDKLGKSTTHIHLGELGNSSIVPVCAVESATLLKNAVDPPCEGITHILDKHADGNIYLVAIKIDEKFHEENIKLEGSRPTLVMENSNSVQPEVSSNVHVKDEVEVCDNAAVVRKDTGCPSPGHSMNNELSPVLERINSRLEVSSSASPTAVGSDLPKNPLPDSALEFKNKSNLESEIKKSGEDHHKMGKKEYEDSIIRKARLLEASLRRASEPSLCNISLEKRRKGHWDFVLEEMIWMANDFMQERLWKGMAASQVCHCIASDGLVKFEEASIQRKQKTVIRSLTKGIMSFWLSAEALRTTGRTPKVMHKHGSDILEKTKPTEIKAEEQGNEFMESEEPLQSNRSQIQDYARRFLEYNCRTSDSVVLAEAPSTPERLNDFGILKVSDQLPEESLFYTVAPGAMLAYRESMESLFMYNKKVGDTGTNDGYEASVCDSIADMAYENAYEEDEGETYTYVLPEGYGGGLSKKDQKKKQLMQQRYNAARPYEMGTDVPYEPCLESKSGNQPLLSNGKRTSIFLAVPTKRIRTAARQRVVSPFPASVGGTLQVTSKTDVSSGDTNSYQDDQSSLHGGALPWKNMDYESTVDFDRQLLYDGSEVRTKASKKKNIKNPGYRTAHSAANSCASAALKGRIYDQRSHLDFIAKYEQKDYLKKRSETKQFYSNVANSGHHASKKLKMMKQGIDMQETSPVASQMSNMVNPAKFFNIITNKDRGRKGKTLKIASSGGWSIFEDQALVVLVHDMGQNWELVSDAINSIVQFKSVYRQPNECKERHKVLADKISSDGADSAEDSGSSQHYHFTIPGIPKGSARQLFQRLQEPFEEENLKAHFEKMILLMQQVHSRRRQGNSKELKSIMQPHSSHLVALSQTCPNNLAGGTLTPLDLCDVMSLNLDPITPGSGYQGSHTNGLTLPNHHGSIVTTTTSNLNSRLAGSPGMVLGSNLPSPSTLSAPSRDVQKYGVSRSTSSQGDEQQKIQYNQTLSVRNHQQPGPSVPGAYPAGIDRGARILPGAHSVGMVTGLNRGMPVARAGFPRVSPPVMLNMVSSRNGLPNSGQGLPNAVNVNPGAMPASGNSMLRPRDPLQMLCPDQNLEEHRQMVMPEFHMQVSQGSSQSVNFSSMNPSLSNAASLSPVQQPQQQHQMPQPSPMFGNLHHPRIQATTHSSPQQQAYAMRLAKERQNQQPMVPQQNDLSVASAAPSLQNGSQIQQQNQTSAASSVPSKQQHQRQQHAQNPPDKLALPNQPANTKQKKQQSQQQPRQNQQQRNQGSQQAKLMKSLGRGNMGIPQTPPVYTAPASTISTSSKKQISDKNLVQHEQGFFPGNKSSIASMPQPGNQHKLYTSPLPQSPNQLPDIGNQGLMQGSPSQNLLASQQSLVRSKSLLTTQQLQQQRQINPSQNSMQRMMMQQNIQMNSDGRADFQIDQVQHNQMVSTAPIPQSTGSGSPEIPPTNQQKQETSLDPPPTSTSKIISSPKDNYVGNETLLPPSNQDMLHMKISGGLPMHGQGIGSQWHQQQSRQHLQSLHQQQQRPAQSGIYTPSNSGPG